MDAGDHHKNVSNVIAAMPSFACAGLACHRWKVLSIATEIQNV